MLFSGAARQRPRLESISNRKSRIVDREWAGPVHGGSGAHADQTRAPREASTCDVLDAAFVPDVLKFAPRALYLCFSLVRSWRLECNRDT